MKRTNFAALCIVEVLELFMINRSEHSTEKEASA